MKQINKDAETGDEFSHFSDIVWGLLLGHTLDKDIRAPFKLPAAEMKILSKAVG